jgi:hypothetical protein
MRGAIAGTSCGIDPAHALGRGHAICGDYFLQSYPDFAVEFATKTGMSVADYYLCISAMMANYLYRMPEMVSRGEPYSAIFNVDTFSDSIAPELRPLFSKYIFLESQTPAELRASLWGQSTPANLTGNEPYDLKALRERPILRVSDGRAIIIDPVLYTEKATVGPLFLLTAGLANKKSNQIFGAFGSSFEVYVNKIFERMYPDANGLLTKRFTKNLGGRDRAGNKIEIADGYLQDISEAALFETKAVWVRDGVILDDNHELYLDQLKERYGQSPRSDERAKGYAQLARAITNIARDEWTTVDADFGRVKKIYPILLVHDPLIDTPVVCNFLNTEFCKLLEPDEVIPSGLLRKRHLLIAPLIIMTVDELEALEISVRHFRLIDLFRDYTVSCPDRIVSLHNFIAATEPYKSKIYANPMLTSKATKLLEETRQKLFDSSRAK